MMTRTLGRTGPAVSAIGLGCMGMSGIYGAADRAESIAVIHAALDAGVTLLDTGDFYDMGHNEMLIGEALKGRRRDGALLSVKFGAQRAPDGSWLGYDARPQAVKTACAYSLKRLGVDHIDIYRPARIDPAVPIEDTVGAIADLVRAGYVRYVSLSEVGADTIRRACAVHPVTDVQIEYSIIARGIEDKVLPCCRELGVGITAYGVLTRGLISGRWSKGKRDPKDMRAHAPRFQGENLEKNLGLVEKLRAIAEARGISMAQLAIAWVSSRGDDIVPVLGARTREQLRETLGALDVRLTPEDLAAIERAAPRGAAAGERYPAQQMANLDSER